MLRLYYIIFLLFFFLGTNASASSSRNLSISADQEVYEALPTLTRLYSQRYNVAVAIAFNPSIQLIGDIDSGESVDVIVSAKQDLIDSLKQKGVVDIYNGGYLSREDDANKYYQVLIIAGENMDVGREFLKFLKSDKASSKMLQNIGFAVN